MGLNQRNRETWDRISGELAPIQKLAILGGAAVGGWVAIVAADIDGVHFRWMRATLVFGALIGAAAGFVLHGIAIALVYFALWMKQGFE